MKHPSEIEWIEGDLPDVHTVPKDCCVLVWFVTDSDLRRTHSEQLRRIEMCFPHEDDLNPLRWYDSSHHPIGWCEKVVHWAWINKGTPTEKVDFKKEGF